MVDYKGIAKNQFAAFIFNPKRLLVITVPLVWLAEGALCSNQDSILKPTQKDKKSALESLLSLLHYKKNSNIPLPPDAVSYKKYVRNNPIL